MTVNEANIGYLPAIVLKEIKAGRKCEVTGGFCRSITSMEDYTAYAKQMRGKFGEVIQWKADRTALIATRAPPEWALEIMEKSIMESDYMARWA